MATSRFQPPGMVRVTAVRLVMGIPPVGDAAVDAERELVGAAGGGHIEAQLEVVVLPDVGAVVADEHVVPGGDTEVEGLGRPSGAEAEVEVRSGGHLAHDGGGVGVVEGRGLEPAPFPDVPVDDRPDAGARRGDTASG